MNENQVAVAQEAVGIKQLVSGKGVQKRLQDMLGKKAAGFTSSIIAISQSEGLKDCSPSSILSSAMVAATMDLPINPNFGMAYVVPYINKGKKEAIFQMGYKGFIQLALRSGQFKNLNAGPIFEGEIKKRNRLTGGIEFVDDDTDVNYNEIVGYFAYFQLINGFEKTLYMSKEEAEAHGKRYSQSYKSNKDFVVKSSLWTTDFDTMATKTVVKSLLSKYAPLSIEMQTALESDQTYGDEGGNRLKAKSPQEDLKDNANSKEFVIDAEYQDTSEPIQEETNITNEPAADQAQPTTRKRNF